MLSVRGRNLHPSSIRLKSMELVDSATVTNVPTTSALAVVNFTAGGVEPASLFAQRPASDELIATLPCLFPLAVWGKSFSLVSGNGTFESARSLPTLRYNDDYDEVTPYLCYLKPKILTITPSAAQQGEL